MKKASIKKLQEEEWQIERDLVLKERKVYILKNEVLKMEIIQLHHDIPVAEHGGRWKMIKLVTKNYQQPRVTRDVGKYTEGCDM